MQVSVPFTRDLVLIGGGHTHALVLRAWGMDPIPGVRLTLIDPGPTTAYSGMLPGFVAGHYQRDELGIDLVRLARFAGARLILGPATGLDLEARTVTVHGRPPVAFDICAIDIGITSAMPALPGFSDHGIPAKPLTPFAKAWDRYRATAKAPSIAVIGGGVAGAELAMAMAHAVRGKEAEVRLIDRGRVLAEFSSAARRRLLSALKGKGVELVEDADVAEVTSEGARLADGRNIAASFVAGAAGARPHGWLEQTGLELHEGFIRVGPTLETSANGVFASGDCAHLGFAPRPKAGVYAVRAAPVLLANLRAALAGGPRRRFNPQKDYLKLISLGGQTALAERGGRAVAGPLLWRWKDWIDRRFMAKLQDLPPMARDLPKTVAKGVTQELGAAPLCGGCGAKVGPTALTTALKNLPQRRGDVLSGPGDDAAVLAVGDARQVITTDHLRAVTEDPVLMTRIAAIHALGDIWAMGAEPQAALVTLILPRASDTLQARTMAEIMATAAEVFGAEGAEIVGGHSSMGAELTIGFTVTGLLDRPAATLSGARAGDRIVLTKPLGSGVILAAEMRGLAPGAVVAGCHEAMTRPQGRIARALSGARAMTDVTGFGLAGHLSRMCAAGGVGARLDLAAIPLLPGALDLAEAGVRSTIYPQNRLAVPGLGSGPRIDLLFDPQTCGGLLAAVPEGLDLPQDAHAIGEITPGSGIEITA